MTAWEELTEEQADAVRQVLEDEDRMLGGWGLPNHLEGRLDIDQYREAIDAALDRLKDVVRDVPEGA